jgi:hypothetical protein
MPHFFGSLEVAITLAFVGTVLAEMTAGDSYAIAFIDLGCPFALSLSKGFDKLSPNGVLIA